jgi:hypothetical protein
VSEAGGTLAAGGDVLKVVRELGLFGAEDVAALTGRAPGEIEAWLRDNQRLVEPVPGRDGMWRALVTAPDETAARPAADPKVAEELADEAVAAIRTIGRGLVQEPQVRNITLEVAEQRIQLAESTARGIKAPKLRARLRSAKRRLVELRQQSDMELDPLLSDLGDWTVRLNMPHERLALSDEGDERSPMFDVDAALRLATKQAANPNAVFMPAHDALLASFTSQQRVDLADVLDREIRTAALRGRVFDVLALGCVAAVTGLGVMADALVAAITTPAFHSVADRGARRIAYTALSNLARPGVTEGYRAAEACTYLMRRERPGRDEMELLAPAALQSETIDPQAALVLFAQWLKWESERDPDAPEEGSSLPQFGHVARNLGCSLDSCGYRQLEHALPSLAEDDLGVLLVRHLSDRRNRALELCPLPPQVRPAEDEDEEDRVADTSRQFGALARAPVAQVTDPERKRPHTYLPVRPRSRVAEAIVALRQQQAPEQPRPDFTRSRRKWAHDHG